MVIGGVDVEGTDNDEEHNDSELDRQDRGHLGGVIDTFDQPEVDKGNNQDSAQVDAGKMPSDVIAKDQTTAEQAERDQSPSGERDNTDWRGASTDFCCLRYRHH